MAASLLHAANPAWVPPAKRRLLFLEGAYLDGVRWPQVQLPKANLAYAELIQADLRGPSSKGHRQGGRSESCPAFGSPFERFFGLQRRLQRGRTRVRAGARAIFVGSDLSQARLDKAILTDARFQEADLRGASLRGAVLTRADFQRALLDETDFSGAQPQRADLSELDLKPVFLRGRRSAGAPHAERPGRACLDELDLSGVASRRRP